MTEGTISWEDDQGIHYESKFPITKDNPDFRVICDTDDRTLWLKERRKYIGASDASAILGVNPWSSALDVYASKLGIDEDEAQSEPAYWGLKLEPIILEEFERRTHRHTEGWGELLVSKHRPWQACTMDGWQAFEGGYGGVEAKATRLAWRWDEGVPDYVYAQIQHQYAVTGFDVISVAVFFNGNAFYQKDVKRDQPYIDVLNEKEEEFYKRLQRFDPPPADASEASKKALTRLHPKDNGGTVKLSPELAQADSTLVILKEEARHIEGVIRGHENSIKQAIGDNTYGILPNGTIYSFKAQTRAQQTIKASTFRVLRRTEGS